MTELSARSNIYLSASEKSLVENAYAGYAKIILEKEFGGGFSNTRVFLAAPVKTGGAMDARGVTKIGLAADLRREQDNYDNFVGPALPFTAARITNYCEQGDQAAINYAFAGGGALGETLILEDYYHAQPAEAINQTLNALLDQTLGETWYGQNRPLNCLFGDEYGRHLRPREELAKIVSAIYPRLSSSDGKHIQIPGVSGTYPDPLVMYPDLLDRTLKGRRSFVHGDLHIRNVLVDESGKGWLIDFAKVKERHNLFDFIKMETYLRLMALAQVSGAFSLNEYLQFEQTLNATTLGQASTPPANPELAKAYQVVQAIRQVARKYMGHDPDFKGEYFPALFLYSLSMLKYFPVNGHTPTQLMFLTSCVLGKSILELNEHSAKSGEILSNDVETEVTILLRGEYEKFTIAEQSGFRFALSRLLNIEPDRINILRVTPGSIYITLKMPQKSARQLMDMWVSNDPALSRLNIQKVALRKEKFGSEPGARGEKAGTHSRASGGVFIGGNARDNLVITGDNNKVRKIDTGGGTYVKGNVNVQNGDFVGGNKIDHSIKVGDISNASGIAIGHGAQVHTTHYSGASADEIAATFTLLLQRVDEMRSGPAKTMTQTAVQGLKTEAEKSERADEGNVDEWFNSLAQIAPDIWDVAIDTFTNPIKGLSTVFQKIAQRAKEEKAQKGKN